MAHQKIILILSKIPFGKIIVFMAKSNKLILFSIMLSLFFSGESTFAQQAIQTSQYMFLPMTYNPGFAGLSNGINASVLHRQQWFGMTEKINDKKYKVNPQTTLLNVDSPIKFLHGGLSVGVAMDKLAHYDNSGFNFGYAYHTNIKKNRLGIGLQMEFTDESIASGELIFPESQGDPVFKEVTEGKANQFLYNVSLGAYYTSPDAYYLSLSFENINGYNADKIGYKAKQNLFLSGGYTFHFPDEFIDLTPSVMIKSDFSTMQMELSAIGNYKNKLWAGLSYRWRDAMVILVGTYIQQFQVGLAYDVSVSSMSSASSIGGGFEIFAKYNFLLEFDKHPRSYKNSRYL